MSYDYSSVVSTAKRLIQKYGALATFTLPSEGGGTDPVTGEYTEPTSETVTAFGVITNYSSALVDGSIIQKGDNRLLVEAEKTIPQTVQSVTIGGTTYQVITVQRISPGGVDIMYQIQVRR